MSLPSWLQSFRLARDRARAAKPQQPASSILTRPVQLPKPRPVGGRRGPTS